MTGPSASRTPIGNAARDEFVLRHGSLRRLRFGSCVLRYRRHARHMTWVWCICGWRADSIERLVFRAEIVERWTAHLPAVATLDE